MATEIPPLAGVLHDFGDHWQIQRNDALSVWVAIERPEPPVLRYYLAADLDQLRQLLENDQEIRR